MCEVLDVLEDVGFMRPVLTRRLQSLSLLNEKAEKSSLRSRFDLVIAAGGDGTINGNGVAG